MDFSTARTRGDGMEFVDTPQNDRNKFSSTQKLRDEDVVQASSNSKSIPGATSIYRPNDESSKSVKLPVKIPQGKQFYLVPHLVNTKKSFTLKNKEPKFVPFEPYKAAVCISQFHSALHYNYDKFYFFQLIRSAKWCRKNYQKSIDAIAGIISI